MYMLHHESHVPAHVALRITLVANPQRKSSSFLVTILKKSAKSPPPLQQYQWLRPTKWPRRAKITEKKLEVGLTQLAIWQLGADRWHAGICPGQARGALERH
jgi:hypothetical protein